MSNSQGAASVAETRSPPAAPAAGAPPPPGGNTRKTKPRTDTGRARTPTVLQMEATECGAASLAMILGFYGAWVPLEVLRIACGVSRDGSKAANVLRAARNYGMEAKGWRKEIDSLAGTPVPFIAFWNFNHFLVVERIDYRRKLVWLNDPASGPRRISLDEFDAGFTGVCLTFQPGPNFRKGGQSPKLRFSLGPRLAGSGNTLLYIVLIGLLLVIPGLAIPAFGKVFVDSILVKGHQRWLIPLLIGLGLTAALRASLTWIQQSQLAKLEMRLSLLQTTRFFWHVLRLPMVFYSQRHPGDVNSRVMANERVAKLLSGGLTVNAVGLLRLGFYAAVMAAYDLRLMLIGVALSGLNIVALRVVARVREDGSRRLAKQQGLLAAASMGGIALIETLKSNGTERDYFQRFVGILANYVSAEQSLSVTSNLVNLLPGVLSGLTTAAILGLGGLRIIEGSMSIGDLVAFQSLMASFNEPITGLVGFAGELQTLKGDLTRLDDVINNPVAPRLADSAAAFDARDNGTAAGATSTQAGKLRGAIEMRGVVFGYSRLDPPLLDGVDLSIKIGQSLALVGGSGSGKSTIAKLLTGLYEPWSGEIRFDGLPLADIPHQVFAASVAAVDQDIFLFEGTVSENVTLWDQSLDDAQVGRALLDAGMLDLVSTRAGGIASHVLEAGRNFSGGQRQRLEIARALVGQPTVLILDEATSALDTLVEAEILERIRQRGITCIIIAHRLSTIRDCDEIIMLERGRIVERGTHAEMSALDGPYRRLISAE
ncbi:MAG TPA: NHLP family bacteriocin export ABC transporter peptidase/permease/ATPase subunit [Stellaceae bacterium]|nr:NHLP family bacteriocin export ABC transporter peptidase/permease/ATPase subunit [Stellaceae bacterium]